MYATCLFCKASLGANEVIETFPVGRRLAFDTAKGRLWVVCRKCERWNLSPFEERWEALDDCERFFRAAKKRVASDNVGLAKLDEGLELVRIGAPLRPEFAAWRYGDQFGRRRRRAMLLGAGAVVLGGAVVWGGIATGIVSGGGYWLFQGIHGIGKTVRNRRTVARVPVSAGHLVTVKGADLTRSHLVQESHREDGWALYLHHTRGTEVLEGHEASHAMSLLMPRVNAAGARRGIVQNAVRHIEAHGNPADYLRHTAGLEPRVRRARMGEKLKGLYAIPIEQRLAIEMAVNEESERIALEGELALLELAWKDAEEVAAIADQLALPQNVETRFEELRRERDAARN